MLFYIIFATVVLLFLLPFIIALFYLLLGINLWRTGSAENNPHKKTSAKTTIVNALAGLVLLAAGFWFVAYWLLGWAF